MDIFADITIYHWLVLGLVLLTAEILGASGFLLGAAMAAFGMSAVLWIAPELHIGWQIVIYAGGTVVLTILYQQLFRDAQKTPVRPLLNHRTKRLLGHQFELEEDIQTGQGKVQIGDTLWTVETAEPISKGTRVEVVGAGSQVLKIQPHSG